MKPKPRLEKAEQADIIRTVRLLGGRVWVLGTHRRRGDYQGTMQSPGLPDLWIVLPPKPKAIYSGECLGLWWEVKRHGEQRTPEQVAFGQACEDAAVPYGYGPHAIFLSQMRDEGRLK